MTIEKTERDGAVTLTCAGCLDTAAAADFAAALEGVAPASALTLDFSALDFIASSGLRALVTANKRAVAAGGSIVLTGLNDVVADVFDVTGLDEVFAIR